MESPQEHHREGHKHDSRRPETAEYDLQGVAITRPHELGRLPCAAAVVVRAAARVLVAVGGIWACASATAAPCDVEGPKEESVVARCTRAIESGVLLGRDLADALRGRANALLSQGEYDLAIQDYDEAMRLAPGQATLFNNRGNAKLRSGQHAAAIADYDQAIRLRADYPSAFNNRGSAWFQAGDYGRALRDYDRAIVLNASYREAHLNRGFVHYIRGAFAAAAGDFLAARRLDPSDPSAVIWLYMAVARATHVVPKNGLASAQLAHRWPLPVARFLNGELRYEELLSIANAGGVAAIDQRCEALFFAAEYEVIRFRRGGAVLRLKQARASCPRSFVEHRAAVADLNRLRGRTQ